MEPVLLFIGNNNNFLKALNTLLTFLIRHGQYIIR